MTSRDVIFECLDWETLIVIDSCGSRFDSQADVSSCSESFSISIFLRHFSQMWFVWVDRFTFWVQVRCRRFSSLFQRLECISKTIKEPSKSTKGYLKIRIQTEKLKRIFKNYEFMKIRMNGLDTRWMHITEEIYETKNEWPGHQVDAYNWGDLWNQEWMSLSRMSLSCLCQELLYVDDLAMDFRLQKHRNCSPLHPGKILLHFVVGKFHNEFNILKYNYLEFMK